MSFEELMYAANDLENNLEEWVGLHYVCKELSERDKADGIEFFRKEDGLSKAKLKKNVRN